MKKIIHIIIIALFFACDSEDANDCIQTAGGLVTEEFSITAFETLLVNRDIEVVLKQATEFKVVVETGENLLNDIEVKVVGNELQLINNNACNYVRDFALTKIYVSAPDIKSIRSSTQYDIASDGVLSYDELTLISENFSSPESFAVGDFRLEINNNSLKVVSNNISAFYISGYVETLVVRFFSGSTRFQGENLLAQDVIIYHRSSNDIIVNPQESITGEIVSTGDVISFNQPPIVEVDELYNGRLIFVN